MRRNSESPWVYLAYPNDSPASDFGPLESFVDLWRSKWPSDDTFPRWRDFEPLDFEGWWGQVSLAEIYTDPIDLKWVLWGTSITNWWGSDYTNKRISEMPNLRAVWEGYEQHYIKRIYNERLIGFVTGSLSPQKRKYTHICGVDLPLERDGQVTHILSAYMLMKPRETFKPSTDHVFRI